MARRARELHAKHPEWSTTEIAKHIPGASHQSVQRALAYPEGRERMESRTLRISMPLLNTIDELAEAAGESTREWVEDAINLKLELVRNARE